VRIFWCVLVLSLIGPLPAYAVNPPQWEELSNGVFVDTANIKIDGDVVGAYVQEVGHQKRATALYDVDCKNDEIRVHSDTPRYRSVPVQGGGFVVQSDDGFRTVVPDSRNSKIESAICGIATQRTAEKANQDRQVQCARAMHDDFLRLLLISYRLSEDERSCLSGLVDDVRHKECDKAGVSKGTTMVQYLHEKGIFLDCEDRPGKQ
jgi:hypothetical protein